MIKDSVYTKSLVDYINDVKPYSSKLVDISVGYQFSDSVACRITEAHTINTNINGSQLIEFAFNGQQLNFALPLSSLTDDAFIGFSNYNTVGQAAVNAIGSVIDSSTPFVSFTRGTQTTIGGNLTVALVDNTHVISSFVTDQYGHVTPLTATTSRTGITIGTVVRRLVGNSFSYSIELNPAYMNAFVPVGTNAFILTRQKTGICSIVNVNITENFKAELDKLMLDFINMKNTNVDYPDGYDMGAFDTGGYGETDSQIGDLASTMIESLSIVSTPVSGGVTEQIVMLNVPNAQQYDVFSINVTDAQKVIINHNFGDTVTDGPNASTGGVAISIIGATATSVSNPYITNSTPLFTTTEVLFATAVTCTINVTVSRA